MLLDCIVLNINRVFTDWVQVNTWLFDRQQIADCQTLSVIDFKSPPPNWCTEVRCFGYLGTSMNVLEYLSNINCQRECSNKFMSLLVVAFLYLHRLDVWWLSPAQVAIIVLLKLEYYTRKNRERTLLQSISKAFWWPEILVREYGISQLTSHQCSRAIADCHDVISIVVTSSKYVGNFDHRSHFTWSFEQVFLRFTGSSKLSQFVN